MPSWKFLPQKPLLYSAFLLTMAFSLAVTVATLPGELQGQDKKSADKGKEKLKIELLVSKYESNGNFMEKRQIYRDKNGEPVNHGKYLFYHLNGKVREELTFRHDKRHGLAKFFHPNGQLAGEVNFEDDKRQGRELVIDPKGVQIGEYNYKDSQPHGKWTWFYDNEKPVQELHYDMGVKSGKWTWWYPNGQKGIEGQYKEDEQDGEWQYWNREGKLTEKRTYSNGEQINKPKNFPIPKDQPKAEEDKAE